MNSVRVRRAGCVVILAACGACFCRAAGADPAAPGWLKWNAEVQGRVESIADGPSDTYYLNRVRVSADVTAAPWLRIYVQGQDARAPGFNEPEWIDLYVHHADFRQGYAQFGGGNSAWQFRAGRQELSFGDERLVSADNFWDPLGTTFDAARLTWHASGVKIDGFGAFAVTPNTRELARASTANQLYGLYASLDHAPRESVIEPYVFWKNNRRTAEEPAVSVVACGLRTTGTLPARFDYNVEMMLEGGTHGDENVRAWAGHWELGYRVQYAGFAPRLAVEYNYASGDRHPGDGRSTTFDDFYSGGFNQYGTRDPFGTRNMRSLAGGMDWKLTKRWSAGLGYRSFWVVSTADLIYVKIAPYVARTPSPSGDHIGNQVLAHVGFEVSSHVKLHAGYTRMVPGSYLIASSLKLPIVVPYVQWTYQF